jgi:histidyl-tRNA synthetase
VGISFGIDRIYDVMEELKLFNLLQSHLSGTKLLLVNFGKEEAEYCLAAAEQLREAGINVELYPDSVKMKKQLAYADSNKIPFVALAGSEEIKSGQFTLKNMNSGEQVTVTLNELITKLAGPKN